MAVLQEVNPFQTPARRTANVTGSLARELALPQVEPQRPQSRPKPARRKNGKTLVIGAFWVFTLVVSLLLVHQNSLVLREKAAITAARTELARLQSRNQELEARLVQLTSVADIERWALAQNMQRPTSARVLQPDPAAVARKSSTDQLLMSGLGFGQQPGFWGSVKGYVDLFTGLLSTKGAH